MARVALVSLGCPKNLVDSECACAEIAAAGHDLVVDKSEADVIIVNTCAFIESAREESVEAISEALEEKQRGRCRGIVVIGCLSQRYGRDLADAEPEIDAVLGVEHAGRIAEAVESVFEGRRVVGDFSISTDWCEPARRIRSTPAWTAYVKISDGCDNRCSYCVIPDIRGPFRSRPESLIIDEAKRFADEGVKELILVGQDLTRYGTDFDRCQNPSLHNGGTVKCYPTSQWRSVKHRLTCKGGAMNGSQALPRLLERLAEIDGLRWIRLMYCYPTDITHELIDVIASCEKVVKYLDMPLQHGDDRILAAMNRRGTVADYLRVIESLREACPDIALRSSFITGFPGETREEFDNLLAFVERIQFDRVSAFVYSREEGTPAWGMRPQVSQRTAVARLDALMRLQQRISREKNRRFVGRKLEVLVEGQTDYGAVGRSYRDAPEIDGVVHIVGNKSAPGEFVSVTITSADEYDLWADACGAAHS